MDKQNADQGQESPRWVPYTPPAATGWERVGVLLRRLAFPVVVLLLGAGVVGLFYWGEPVIRMGMGESPSRDARQSTQIPKEVVDRRGGNLESHSRLSVYSSPSGATVRMNGDSVGVTPVVDRTTETGPYLFSLEADGYFRRDTVLVLQAERPATIDVTLRPRPGARAPAPEAEASPSLTDERSPRALPQTSVSSPAPADRPDAEERVGALYVTSVPSGAVVRVNGTRQGRTPVPIRDLSPGPTRIGVTLDNYMSWSREIEVGAGSMRRVHAELRPQTGRLRILVRPWGNIYVNGELEAREHDVWYEMTLPVGGHEVQAIHPVLGEETRRVRVTGGTDTSVVIDLRAN